MRLLLIQKPDPVHVFWSFTLQGEMYDGSTPVAWICTTQLMGKRLPHSSSASSTENVRRISGRACKGKGSDLDRGDGSDKERSMAGKIANNAANFFFYNSHGVMALSAVGGGARNSRAAVTAAACARLEHRPLCTAMWCSGLLLVTG